MCTFTAKNYYMLRKYRTLKSKLNNINVRFIGQSKQQFRKLFVNVSLENELCLLPYTNC